MVHCIAILKPRTSKVRVLSDEFPRRKGSLDLREVGPG